MANAAVIFADPSGVIQYWNSGMTELVGFNEHEALGATLGPKIQSRGAQELGSRARSCFVWPGSSASARPMMRSRSSTG
jgi:PAS domain-containing protein